MADIISKSPITFTLQNNILRDIVDVVKDLTHDMTLIIDKDNICISHNTTSYSCCVKIDGNQSNIKYNCANTNLFLQLNSVSFYKVLKSIHSSKTIIFGIDEEGKEIKLSPLHDKDKYRRMFYIKTNINKGGIDMMPDSIEEIQNNTGCIIQFKSSEFLHNLKEAASMSDNITLEIYPTKLQMTNIEKTHFVKQEIELMITDNNIIKLNIEEFTDLDDDEISIFSDESEDTKYEDIKLISSVYCISPIISFLKMKKISDNIIISTGKFNNSIIFSLISNDDKYKCFLSIRCT